MVGKMKLNRNLRRARSEYVVIIPTDRELQIDLDGPEALRRYGWQFEMFKRNGLADGWKEKVLPSKTPGHVHVIITMPQPMKLKNRIAVQTILGDDIKRAAFNWIRACKRSRVPIALFRKK